MKMLPRKVLVVNARSPSASRQGVTESPAESADSGWTIVYRLGGVTALLSVLIALLDIIVSLLRSEKDVEPGRLSATDWCARRAVVLESAE